MLTLTSASRSWKQPCRRHSCSRPGTLSPVGLSPSNRQRNHPAGQHHPGKTSHSNQPQHRGLSFWRAPGTSQTQVRTSHRPHSKPGCRRWQGQSQGRARAAEAAVIPPKDLVHSNQPLTIGSSPAEAHLKASSGSESEAGQKASNP
jgi:hypothetical protein